MEQSDLGLHCLRRHFVRATGFEELLEDLQEYVKYGVACCHNSENTNLLILKFYK